jgi:hypothetical protein
VLVWGFPQVFDSLLGAKPDGKTSLCLHETKQKEKEQFPVKIR